MTENVHEMHFAMLGERPCWHFVSVTTYTQELCAHPVLLFDARAGIQGDLADHTGLQMGLQACKDL